MRGRDWPAEGATFTVVYPFCRTTFEWYDDDGPTTVNTWRPGISVEQLEYGDTDNWADARGKMLLTVVSVHKPGRYPTRVFYTRKWADPDGNIFGKGGLRVCTLEKFRRISTSYSVPYDYEEPDHEPDPAISQAEAEARGFA